MHTLIAAPVHTVAMPLSYWNLLITMVLPALVALTNTRFAPGHVKVLTLMLLSVVGGLINQAIAQGGSFEVGKTLWYIALTFGVAVLAHFGLLAPLSVTGANGVIAKNLPGGVGPLGTDKNPPIVPGEVIAPPPTITGGVSGSETIPADDLGYGR